MRGRRPMAYHRQRRLAPVIVPCGRHGVSAPASLRGRSTCPIRRARAEWISTTITASRVAASRKWAEVPATFISFYSIQSMTTTNKSPAKRKYCVWADDTQRVYQDVEAANPMEAYAMAQEQRDDWISTDSHDDDGYRLS